MNLTFFFFFKPSQFMATSEEHLTVLGIASGSSFFWGGPAIAPGKPPCMLAWGPGIIPPN